MEAQVPGFFSYWIAMIATLAVICGSPGQAQTNKTPLPCGGPTGTQPTIHRLQTSGDCMTVFVFGKAANARKLVLFAHGDYEKKENLLRGCNYIRRQTKDPRALIVCGYRSNALTPNSAQKRGRKDDVVRQVQLLNWAKKECPDCETILIGYSRGGQLLAGATQLSNHRVNCLILGAPPLDYEARDRRKKQNPSRKFYDAARYTRKMKNVAQIVLVADPVNDEIVDQQDWIRFVSRANADGVPTRVIETRAGHDGNWPQIYRALGRSCK
jgi:predicted alpha/beta hydrolase family esterase